MTEQRDPNYVTDKAIYFYTPRFYAFDNFSAFAVRVWGKEFSTTEQAYQWKKYSVSSPDIADQILRAKSAYATKKIADAHKEGVDSAWHDEKLTYMEEILRAKIEQHEKIKMLLIETGDRDIIENSPTDYFWGIGEDGTGENQLGKLFMKLRAELL